MSSYDKISVAELLTLFVEKLQGVHRDTLDGMRHNPEYEKLSTATIPLYYLSLALQDVISELLEADKGCTIVVTGQRCPHCDKEIP